MKKVLEDKAKEGTELSATNQPDTKEVSDVVVQKENIEKKEKEEENLGKMQDASPEKAENGEEKEGGEEDEKKMQRL